MSSVAFSPSFIWVTPSSQPAIVSVCPHRTPPSSRSSRTRGTATELTLDDATDTNSGLEGTTAGLLGGVELLALGAVGVLQPAGVQHGDLVAFLGRRAVALGDGGLGNTHGSSGRVEERSCVAWLECAGEVGIGCSLEGFDEGRHGGGVVGGVFSCGGLAG